MSAFLVTEIDNTRPKRLAKSRQAAGKRRFAGKTRRNPTETQEIGVPAVLFLGEIQLPGTESLRVIGCTAEPCRTGDKNLKTLRELY